MRRTLHPQFRYWNANEGKEYFSDYRYTMAQSGQLGSFAPGGAFELILRETSTEPPICETCGSCTDFAISYLSLKFRQPIVGLCVEVEGMCKTTSSVLGFPGVYPCVNDDNVDCTATCPSPPSPPPACSPDVVAQLDVGTKDVSVISLYIQCGPVFCGGRVGS